MGSKDESPPPKISSTIGTYGNSIQVWQSLQDGLMVVRSLHKSSPYKPQTEPVKGEYYGSGTTKVGVEKFGTLPWLICSSAVRGDPNSLVPMPFLKVPVLFTSRRRALNAACGRKNLP